MKHVLGSFKTSQEKPIGEKMRATTIKKQIDTQKMDQSVGQHKSKDVQKSYFNTKQVVLLQSQALKN